MLFIKNTQKTVAPGVYAVDVAAKPPGKTFAIFMAVDDNNPPQTLIEALEQLGFTKANASSYTHNDGKKVLDLHFNKIGTDIFQGWSEGERESNLQALQTIFGKAGIEITPRVMSLAEAF